MAPCPEGFLTQLYGSELSSFLLLLGPKAPVSSLCPYVPANGERHVPGNRPCMDLDEQTPLTDTFNLMDNLKNWNVI